MIFDNISSLNNKHTARQHSVPKSQPSDCVKNNNSNTSQLSNNVYCCYANA